MAQDFEFGTRYMNAVLALLERAKETQAAALADAAGTVTDSVLQGGRVFIFGSGHSHMMAEEGHYRAGGLAAVVPILSAALMLHESAMASTAYERLTGFAPALLARYTPQPHEPIIIFSNSGVNAAPVELAKTAREKYGMPVIAIVSLAYEKQAPLSPLGVRLSEVASIVIDNGGVAGDALIELPEQGLRTGPTSTVVGAFLLNCLLTEVAARVSRDKPGLSPVYISANIAGAGEHNRALVDRYRAGNPHL